MIRCARKATEVVLCVIENGEMAYIRDSRGPICAQCRCAMDVINEELRSRGLEAIEPDWATYLRGRRRA